MQYTQSNTTYVLNIEKGEEVVSMITEFCQKEGIANGYFRGIGAVDALTCGYYALDEKKYYFTDYHELLEVVSLTGNVMLKEGKSFVHMHGVFTNTKNEAFGGHIKEMTVGVVLEVILEKLDTDIKRLHNDEIGLFLQSCGKEV
jgi:predicted DNA-binding protein with PD1-like motif